MTAADARFAEGTVFRSAGGLVLFPGAVPDRIIERDTFGGTLERLVFHVDVPDVEDVILGAGIGQAVEESLEAAGGPGGADGNRVSLDE